VDEEMDLSEEDREKMSEKCGEEGKIRDWKMEE
jgi:hypothetical protein